MCVPEQTRQAFQADPEQRGWEPVNVKSTPRFRSQMIGGGLVVLLLAITGLAVELVDTLRVHQRMAADLAEVNSIKYGLLNADAWVDQVAAIVEQKIDEFRLTPEGRKTLKPTIERMLDALITQTATDFEQQNKKGTWVKRKLRKGIQNAVFDIDKIRAAIPKYADRILDEIDKPASRRQLGSFFKAQLGEVSDSTFSEVDPDPVDALDGKYQCHDRASCQQRISGQIEDNRSEAMRLTLLVLAASALLFIGVGAAPDRKEHNRLGLLALCCTVLMACGVLTPMIDVEARITELHFVLLGQPVAFTDQVLYFQSKSVLDVVRILTSTGRLDMILVGALMIVFCLVFPLAKLAASFVYLYDLRGLRHSAITKFFALKSGKWSMADVFVVAMLMAYVGFNGLIANELSKFAAAGGAGVDILTTNGTSLQIGFSMFLAFCLANLVTSTLIDSAIRSQSPG